MRSDRRYRGRAYLGEHPVPSHTDDAVIVVKRGGLNHLVSVLSVLRHDHLGGDAGNLEDGGHFVLPDLLGCPVPAERVDEDEEAAGAAGGRTEEGGEGGKKEVEGGRKGRREVEFDYKNASH